MLTTFAQTMIAADHRSALLAEADRARIARACRSASTSGRRRERSAGHRWLLRRRRPVTVTR